MLQVLILICSANISAAECQLETASDVINGPKVASVMECGLHGQTLLAQGGLLKRADGDYAKIKCTHQKAVALPATDRTAQKL